MGLNLKTVAEFVRKADTEDLLDRVTVYRDGMEPAAVDLMENELWRRGVTPEELAEHDEGRRQRVVMSEEGYVLRCLYCDRPAVSRRWGLHWIGKFFKIPFPWLLSRCAFHDPLG